MMDDDDNNKFLSNSCNESNKNISFYFENAKRHGFIKRDNQNHILIEKSVKTTPINVVTKTNTNIHKKQNYTERQHHKKNNRNTSHNTFTTSAKSQLNSKHGQFEQRSSRQGYYKTTFNPLSMISISNTSVPEHRQEQEKIKKPLTVQEAEQKYFELKRQELEQKEKRDTRNTNLISNQHTRYSNALVIMDDGNNTNKKTMIEKPSPRYGIYGDALVWVHIPKPKVRTITTPRIEANRRQKSFGNFEFDEFEDELETTELDDYYLLYRPFLAQRLKAGQTRDIQEWDEEDLTSMFYFAEPPPVYCEQLPTCKKPKTVVPKGDHLPDSIVPPKGLIGVCASMKMTGFDKLQEGDTRAIKEMILSCIPWVHFTHREKVGDVVMESLRPVNESDILIYSTQALPQNRLVVRLVVWVEHPDVFRVSRSLLCGFGSKDILNRLVRNLQLANGGVGIEQQQRTHNNTIEDHPQISLKAEAEEDLRASGFFVTQMLTRPGLLVLDDDDNTTGITQPKKDVVIPSPSLTNVDKKTGDRLVRLDDIAISTQSYRDARHQIHKWRQSLHEALMKSETS